MKRIVVLLLIALMVVSCHKKETEQQNTGNVRIVIDTFSDLADTISIKFHSYTHISILGAQFPKYVLQLRTQNYYPFIDSSFNGTFRLNNDGFFYMSGYRYWDIKVYGGSSSQSNQQIIQNGVYLKNRQVTVRCIGLFVLPEPVWERVSGTLQGSYDTVLPMTALSVSKQYVGSPGCILIDSVAAGPDGRFRITDNSYVGEKAFYSLKGYTMTDSAGLAVSGERLSVKAMEIPSHEVHSDATGNPVMSWNKNLYGPNFGKYRIYMQKNDTYSPPELLKEINDINDTVETQLDLGFPGLVHTFVTHLPKVNSQYIDVKLELEYYGNLVDYQPGISFPPFDEFTSRRGDDVYFMQSNGTYLYRYSTSSSQVIDSIYCQSGRYAVSGNDKYVLTLRGDRFHLYDVSSRQDISIAISDFLPLANVNDFDVSDNGTMAVMNGFSSLKLIDVIHNQLLGTLPMSNYTLNIIQMSADGNYVHVYTEDKHRIYRFSNGTFTEVYNHAGFDFSSMQFIPDQPGKVLLFVSDKYQIYNLITSAVELELNCPPFGQAPQVDFNDDLLMITDEHYMHFYDLMSGTQVKSIVFHINSGLYHKTYLHKHSLYNGIGTKMTFQVK